MKVIFHLDLDSYFVSAHRTVDSKLLNKPVAISMGGRRSIISAASYEAKRKGVKVPMPLYQAKELAPDLVIVPPNFALYTVLSTKVFELIQTKFTPNIEVASIDECYIDVTKIWQQYGSPLKLAQVLQNQIKEELSLPVSIGVANNKFVAKMSTQINKPFGITITKPGDFLKVFGSWKVETFHGIGLPTASKLQKINIFTIEDLAKANEEDVIEILGKVGKDVIKKVREQGDDEVDSSYNDLKSIGNSITFQDRDRFQREDILEVFKQLCSMVSQRAINRNQVGNTLAIAIKEKGGKEVKAKSVQEKLKVPINDYKTIYQEVEKLFDQIWQGQIIKFAGVTLTNLENVFATTFQSTIFDKEKEKTKVESIIDNINHKFKNKVVVDGKEFAQTNRKKERQTRYIESDRIIKHFDRSK